MAAACLCLAWRECCHPLREQWTANTCRCLLVLSLWCVGFSTTMTTNLRRVWVGGVGVAQFWLSVLTAVVV